MSDIGEATVQSRKKMALITFKFVDSHPRVNRLAKAFSEAGYTVTIYGLSKNPRFFRNADGIKFVTFPLNIKGANTFVYLVRLPMKILMGLIGVSIITYCAIRKI